ncbi:MAG: nuclear transport factor 2 family protein [Candidatus Promineifilaceae bacterium]
MTSKLDIVKAWIDASSMEASKTYIADDFQSVDHDGNVIMDKAGYLGMGAMMYASFRGFRFVHNDLREEGDFVFMTGHFEGTHIADLDLSAMGMGVISASGKKIVWPDASVKFTLAGDKIVREEPYGESGGMEAFLAPLLEKQPSA